MKQYQYCKVELLSMVKLNMKYQVSIYAILHDAASQ